MGTPAKPATTPSLPGANSTRTDGPGSVASKQAQRYISGMPFYGDGQELANLQAQAPMSATPDVKPVSIAASAAQQGTPAMAAPTPVVGLMAPTQRPDEPGTAGSPMGAGPGLEALGIMPGQSGGGTARQTVDTLAAHPDASPELKRLANLLGQ